MFVNVDKAITLLKNNAIIAFPTETVYGLGANAFSNEAVLKIFKAKRRPLFNPLIVHVKSISELEKLITKLPKAAEKLIRDFWPGPLTLVLPKSKKIPDIVSAGLPTMGIRMPSHPIANELLQKLDFPLAAPSANLFTQVSCTNADDVEKNLGSVIDGVIDGGSTTIGLESTIVGFEEEEVVLLRYGGLAVEQIENSIGKKLTLKIHNKKVLAPGMLKKHYSPLIPLKIVSNIWEIPRNKEVGVLSFGFSLNPNDFGSYEELSISKNLDEAAAQFFSSLRRLESSRIKIIYSVKFPSEGLGLALNDRLERASS